MMKIRINGGEEKTIDWIASTRDGKSTHIRLEDERALSKIAAEFENAQEIRAMDESRKKAVSTIYEGYTKLTEIRREGGGGVIITLEHA